MRLVIMGLLLALSGASHAGQGVGLTLNQRGTMSELIHDDLLSYLKGEDSLLKDDWAMVATPWQSDQQIGIKYARNAVDADAELSGKLVFAQGHFVSVENWLDDTYRLQMQLVAAIVPKQNAAFLQGESIGGEIKIACHAQGLELGMVYLVDCEQPRDATSELVSRETEKLTSSNGAMAKRIEAIARAEDAKIDPDDPCRNTWGGCLDVLHQHLTK